MNRKTRRSVNLNTKLRRKLRKPVLCLDFDGVIHPLHKFMGIEIKKGHLHPCLSHIFFGDSKAIIDTVGLTRNVQLNFIVVVMIHAHPLALVFLYQ